jgi:hypothetical protein
VLAGGNPAVNLPNLAVDKAKFAQWPGAAVDPLPSFASGRFAAAGPLSLELLKDFTQRGRSLQNRLL